MESKISPKSSTVTRNCSVLESPATAENLDFEDTPAPDFENVKYRMVSRQTNDRNTCIDIKPSGGDYPGTSLASHTKCYTADAELPPQASAENRPVLPPRRVTLPTLSLANTEHSIWP
jgi:hypothetical protein